MFRNVFSSDIFIQIYSIYSLFSTSVKCFIYLFFFILPYIPWFLSGILLFLKFFFSPLIFFPFLYPQLFFFLFFLPVLSSFFLLFEHSSLIIPFILSYSPSLKSLMIYFIQPTHILTDFFLYSFFLSFFLSLFFFFKSFFLSFFLSFLSFVRCLYFSISFFPISFFFLNIQTPIMLYFCYLQSDVLWVSYFHFTSYCDYHLVYN